MNYIDLLLLVLFLYAIYRGFTKGFINELAALVALILGIFGAIKFSDLTADWLTREFNMHGQYMTFASFAVTFLVIVIIVHVIAHLIDTLVKAIALGFINRLLGVLFGIVKMAFILSVILGLLNTLDRRFSFLPEEDIRESLFYEPIASLAPAVFPYLKFNQLKPQEPDTTTPGIVVNLYYHVEETSPLPKGIIISCSSISRSDESTL
jgi:membrane protein required for colicin V production